MLVVRAFAGVEDRVLRSEAGSIRIQPRVDVPGFDRDGAAIMSRSCDFGGRLVGYRSERQQFLVRPLSWSNLPR